jgi:hypothetical protein
LSANAIVTESEGGSESLLMGWEEIRSEPKPYLESSSIEVEGTSQVGGQEGEERHPGTARSGDDYPDDDDAIRKIPFKRVNHFHVVSTSVKWYFKMAAGTHSWDTAGQAWWGDFGYSLLNNEQATFIANNYYMASLEKYTGKGQEGCSPSKGSTRQQSSSRQSNRP